MSQLRQQKDKQPKPFISDEIALVAYAALLALWIGCLLWSSLSSNLPHLPRILAWDKLQHFSAYAILMFLSANFFQILAKRRKKGTMIAFIFTLSFGLLMEIGQGTLSSTRHADLKDFIANTLGAGSIFIYMLLKRENHP